MFQLLRNVILPKGFFKVLSSNVAAAC